MAENTENTGRAAAWCNNPELLAIGDNSALIFYSDFYYPDETGVKRKTILCRQIKVEIE